jgi:hypothetical protein
VVEALALATEAVAIAQGMDDRRLLAWTRQLLGMTFYASDDLDAARSTLEEALDLSRRWGNYWCELSSMMCLALVLGDQGSLPQAARLLADSLAWRRDAGATTIIAWGLTGLADVAFKANRFDSASLLLGAAETQSGVGGSGPFFALVARAERAKTGLQQRLGEKRLAEGMAHGRSLSTAAAIAHALWLADDLEASATG